MKKVYQRIINPKKKDNASTAREYANKNVFPTARIVTEEMMVSESVKNEWREFSYIASELHKRRIETIIKPEREDIQLRDEETGETFIFGSFFEVKAFALGLDWGVKNARDMDLCGLRSSICKEEKK